MEGVKSSPNNPGRQAILLSTLTLSSSHPPFLSSPCPSATSLLLRVSAAPIVSLFSSASIFPGVARESIHPQPRLLSLFIPMPARHHSPRSTWNHGGLTFIVSDNLPAEKASGTLRRIHDRPPTQSVFGRYRRIETKTTTKRATVKAPSRR